MLHVQQQHSEYTKALSRRELADEVQMCILNLTARDFADLKLCHILDLCVKVQCGTDISNHSHLSV